MPGGMPNWPDEFGRPGSDTSMPGAGGRRQGSRRATNISFTVTDHPGHHPHHLRGFAVRMGRHYDQDAVLFKPADSDRAHLIGTNATGFPGLFKVHDVGDFYANRLPELHTLLKGGRTFSFEGVNESAGHWETFAVTNPRPFFSRRETLF